MNEVLPSTYEEDSIKAEVLAYEEDERREYPEDVLEFRKTNGGVISEDDEIKLQALKGSLALRGDIVQGSIAEEFLAKQALVDYYKELFKQFPDAERFSVNKEGNLIPDENGSVNKEDLLLKARLFHSWCVRFIPVLSQESN